ncbi:MAG: type II secretion system protein [Gemmatimonadota bacterium]
MTGRPSAWWTLSGGSEARRALGWTLIEIVLALVITAVLAALVLPGYTSMVERRRRAEAIADIRTIEAEIEAYAFGSRRPPPTLGEIGWATRRDPWGRPYRYLRFDGLDWVLRARIDRFDVPINSTYDLYSVGPDGRSALSLQLPESRDDMIRANDGAYVGPAWRF